MLCDCPWTLCLAAPFVLLAILAVLWHIEAPAVGPRKKKHGQYVVADTEAGKKEDYDVVIVGAGVVGGALAARMKTLRPDLSVVVVESMLDEPNRIIGELMQPGGIRSLQQMGLEGTLDGIDNAPTEGYAIYRPIEKDWAHLPYTQGNPGEKDGKFRGCGLHNGRFLMRLRDAATKAGAELKGGLVKQVLVRGLGTSKERVTGVRFMPTHSNGQTVAGAEMQEVRGKLVVVANGMDTSFRNEFCDTEVRVASRFSGIVLEDCPLPFPGHGHVVLAKPTPVLLYPITPRETRMLIDLPNTPEFAAKGLSTNTALIAYFRSSILPQLPEAVRPSFSAALDKAASGEGHLSTCANRKVAARPAKFDGVVTLGDLLNMRHPLTGGGMTCALGDVHILTNRLAAANWKDEHSVNGAIASFYKDRRDHVKSINVLADALYAVFGGGGKPNKDLTEGCFMYLGNGGLWADGPVRLLSGVSRNQWLLFGHFFAVAFYSLGRLLLPIPTPGRIFRAFGVMRTAVRIIAPLMLEENRNAAMWLVTKALRVAFCV